MASNRKLHPRNRGNKGRFAKRGTVSHPISLDARQLASGQGAEDRADELADWLDQFEDGVYRDDSPSLSIARKF